MRNLRLSKNKWSNFYLKNNRKENQKINKKDKRWNNKINKDFYLNNKNSNI